MTSDEYKKKYGVDPFVSAPPPLTQHQSIDTLKAEQAKAEKESSKGLLRRTLSALIPSAYKVGVGGPAQFIASAAEVPQTLATGKASDKTYKLPGLDPFKSIQSEAQQAVREGSQTAGQAILTKGLKTVGEGLETVGATKYLGGDVNLKTGQVQKGLIPKTIENTVASRNTNKIWNLIQPKLSTLEQAEAVKTGQIAKTGLTRKVAQVPDQEMIEAVKPYIKTLDPIKATAQMQEGIGVEANKIRSKLQQSQAIWNRNELMGAINKVEQPHLLTGDIKKAYVKSLNLTLKEAQNSSKTLDGLLDVRQSFDRIVRKQYPDLYSNDTLTPIKSAVMDTRRAINKLIEAKLPETVDKQLFIDSLRKQTRLYEAVDNVATKVPKIGTSVLTKFSKIKKALIYGGETILGYEGVKKLLGK